MAFTRISDKEILLRSQVYNPDIVVVLDPVILELVNVTDGLKADGWLIANTPKKPEELGLNGSFKIATVDATGIALELNLKVAGFAVVNTPMLGAFSKATKLVSLESVKRVILEEWKGELAELNAKAAELAFEKTIVKV
jgi:2-oxoacid:acceptor oxidoreductase gamma subunit (pyruvate/2-ketoisovalerate family)